MRRVVLQYCVLAAFALLVYAPALGGDFVWDDEDWIRDNETLRTLGGLWRIWFEPGAVIQYYPLTYTSWWLDHWLWDLSPRAMHIENVLLHAANALLFGSVLRRLAMPVAGCVFGALLFLLHPVHSESVAWLVERKNVLSGLFYLLALRSFLARPAAGGELPPGPAPAIWRSGVWFALALLAKTATLMLPATIFAAALWQQRRAESGWQPGAVRAAVRRVLPFVGLSIVFAAITIVRERGEGAVGYEWSLTLADRVALFGQNVVFYAGKLLWPAPGNLCFVYPKWPIDSGTLFAYAPTLGVVAALVVGLFARRNRVLCTALALLVYVANLLPVSGLVDFFYLRYAFAADHFQYFASLGPLALAAGASASLLMHNQLARAAALVVLGLLSWSTWQRAEIYRDLETLWRATIAAEPTAWLAQSNLGNLLDQRDGEGAGLEHHMLALAAYPEAFESNNAVGNHLVRTGDIERAQEHYDRALLVRPDDPLTYSNLGAMHGMRGDLANAKVWLERGYRKAPENRSLQRNLATLLAQAPSAELRDGPRALRLARQLNDVSAPSLLDQYILWRAMLIAAGRGEAIRFGERVRDRAAREGAAGMTARIKRQLDRMRARQRGK
ncbi:MAG: hypothetical protein AB8H80_05795 [Planctomycetota bacterium]